MEKSPKKPSKAKDLLGVLSQTPNRPTPLPQEKPTKKSAEPQPPVPDLGKMEKRTKTRAFSLHPEDAEKLQSLAMWFSGQGVKITDSMVIRCALRLAEPGKELIDAYHQARQLDQRVKKNKQ